MLIGISGKIKSGKDTIGDIIVNDFWENGCGGKFHALYRRSFADKLKAIVAAIVGCHKEDLDSQEFKSKAIPDFTKISQNGIITHVVPSDKIFYNDVFKEYSIVTYREALQFFGTKFRNEYGENFWVNLLLNSLPSTSKEEIILITDVRYLNEAEAIKSRGGILIRVNRPHNESPKDISNHPSETGLDNYNNFDYIIENDGSLEDLEGKVKLIYSHLKTKH